MAIFHLNCTKDHMGRLARVLPELVPLNSKGALLQTAQVDLNVAAPSNSTILITLISAPGPEARYGVWRIYIRLRREGFKDLHEWLHGIYKKEGPTR